MSKAIRGPYFSLRSFEYVEDGKVLTLFEPDEEDMKRPFVKIENFEGKTVTTNHDLFSFKEADTAKLLAAAPDLFEALEEAEKTISGWNDSNDLLFKIRKALQKAKA